MSPSCAASLLVFQSWCSVDRFAAASNLTFRSVLFLHVSGAMLCELDDRADCVVVALHHHPEKQFDMEKKVSNIIWAFRRATAIAFSPTGLPRHVDLSNSSLP